MGQERLDRLHDKIMHLEVGPDKFKQEVAEILDGLQDEISRLHTQLGQGRTTPAVDASRKREAFVKEQNAGRRRRHQSG